MKRLVLIICALAASVLPGAAYPDYYLAGEFNTWKPNLSAYKFAQNGDIYTLEMTELKGEFKITTSAWEHQYGSGRAMMPGTVYALTESDNSFNMTIADQSAKNITLIFDNKNKTIEISLKPDLYLVGDFNNWKISTSYKFAEVDGRYILYTKAFKGEFKVVSEDETFTLGGPSNPDFREGQEKQMAFDGNSLNFAGTSSGAATVKITVDPAGTPEEDSSVGTVGVEVPINGMEYYNLQGVKVSNPSPGVYIRRTGSKTEKIIIR